MIAEPIHPLEYPALLSFELVGVEPAPKGSIVPMKTKRGLRGRADCKRLKTYQQALTLAACEVYRGEPIEAAVGVVVEFLLPRPLYHYTAGDPSRPIRAKYAAAWPTTEVDTDKLCRAVGDALEGRILKNDAQIVGWLATQRYANPGEQTATIVSIHANPENLPWKKTKSRAD